MVNIFMAYAQEDELLVNMLEGFLVRLQQNDPIRIYKHEISQVKSEASTYLNKAHIILLLVSPDFLDSDYCYSIEIAQLIERHERGEIHVIPVILRPVYWGRTPFSQLQAVPRDATPITLWNDQEIAFEEVVTTVKIALVKKGMAQTQKAPQWQMREADGSSFGSVLRFFRRREKLTQRELAKKLEVHENSVSLWERALERPESHSVVLKIAEIFHLNEEDKRLLFEARYGTASILPLYNVPFERNPYFTGRETLLQQLHEQLTASKQIAIKQAVSGIGGVGKTQIALEYVYRYGESYHDILWATADTLETLTGSYMKLAELLRLREKDLQDQNIIVAAVKRWLSTHERWLLILDDVEDFSLVNRFIPSGRQGGVLLTTQSQVTEPIAQSIEINCMEEEEGALFLLRRAHYIKHDEFLAKTSINDDNTTLAKTISLELGGLPLALDQAGAYVRETGCSLSDYLASYMKRRADLLHRRGRIPTDHSASVTTTFSLALERVTQKHSAAPELLRFFAFLAPDAIPEELVARSSPHLGPVLQSISTDEIEFDSAIEALRTFSLVYRDTAGKALSVHRLVQAVLKDGMDDSEQEVGARRAVQAVSSTFPDIKVENWGLCDLWLPHAQVCIDYINKDCIQTLEAARLLSQTGLYLQKRGNYVEAEVPLQKALEMKERIFGGDDLEVAESLHRLAELYRTMRKRELALPLYQRALEIRKQRLGEEHPDVATSLNDLALFYRSQGKFSEAEPLHVRALEVMEKALGPEHLKVATILNNLAGFHRTNGKYAEAEPLFLQALKIRKQQLGEEHPYVVQVLNNLAGLYREQEKYAEAEPFYLQALLIREQVLGPGHSDVAQSLNGLGDLYRAQGRYEKAEQMLRRALQIRKQSLGEKHWDTLQSLVSLAELHRAQGTDEKAKALYAQVLHIWEQDKTGTLHAGASLNGLAYIYEKRGEYMEAERLLLRALQLGDREQLGPNAPRIKVIRDHYVSLLRSQGREEEAREVLREQKAFSSGEADSLAERARG